MPGRRPGTPRSRMRINRAIQVDSEAMEVGAVAQLSAAIPWVIAGLIEDARTDPDARKQVIELVGDDIARARSGQRDELLLKLAEVRKAGSPILETLWARLEKAAFAYR